jgi:hypothetical protein
MLAACGQVKAAFMPYRVQSRPYPALEVECGSLGGMSGGAVLGTDGRLVGVVSRGFSDGEPPTEVAWIIGGLNLRVILPWPEGMYREGEIGVLSVPEGLLTIEGRDAVAVTDRGTIEYRIWFRS